MLLRKLFQILSVHSWFLLGGSYYWFLFLIIISLCALSFLVTTSQSFIFNPNLKVEITSKKLLVCLKNIREDILVQFCRNIFRIIIYFIIIFKLSKNLHILK